MYDDDMSTTSSRKTSSGEGLGISDGEERNFAEEVNPQVKTSDRLFFYESYSSSILVQR